MSGFVTNESALKWCRKRQMPDVDDKRRRTAMCCFLNNSGKKQLFRDYLGNSQP